MGFGGFLHRQPAGFSILREFLIDRSNISVYC